MHMRKQKLIHIFSIPFSLWNAKNNVGLVTREIFSSSTKQMVRSVNAPTPFKHRRRPLSSAVCFFEHCHIATMLLTWFDRVFNLYIYHSAM